jgi:hypothetical protein
MEPTMKKTILTFGLISGVLSSLMMMATVPFLDRIGFNKGEYFGYTAMVEKLKASGASPAAVQAQLQQVKKYKEMYDNPFLNAAMTFIEPFPIGLVITLISAAVLRRKPQSQPAQSLLPASH